VRFEAVHCDDAEVVIVAYGTVARVSKEVLREARAAGTKVGLLRPITLWPFPKGEVGALAERGVRFFVVEMSLGQMVEDVRLAVEGRRPVDFLGVAGGAVPTAAQILQKVMDDGS
jgi:2-oxoglutarate ferredoxin oxidoreductase subunit alpha